MIGRISADDKLTLLKALVGMQSASIETAATIQAWPVALQGIKDRK